MSSPPTPEPAGGPPSASAAAATDPAPDPRRRRRRVRLLLVAWSFALAFGLAELALRVLTKLEPTSRLTITGLQLLPFDSDAEQLAQWLERRRSSTSTYVMADPELGWTIGRNGSSQHGQSNAQGVRCEPSRVYSEQPAPGVRRIAAFGDSFTHGDEVRLEDSWPHLLEQMLEGHEVLNFGVSGYGTDQAYLRWRREAAQVHPHQVLLGIWPEQLCRNLNVNRLYLTLAGDTAFKPRFLLEDGALRLLGSPVPEDAEVVGHILDPEGSALLRHDYWYRPEEQQHRFWHRSRFLRYAATVWNRKARRDERHRIYDASYPEGTALTVAIARRFAEEAAALGQEPIVMLIPMHELLGRFPGGERPMPLVRDLRAAGVTVWDHSPAFAAAVERDGRPRYFLPSGHLTPDGNRLLASEIAALLR